MTDESKSVILFLITLVFILISCVMLINAIGNRLEISEMKYQEIIVLKDEINKEPNDKGWDVYRDWIKQSTEDNYISNKEYQEYLDIKDNISKQNTIIELKALK